jgi:N-acetylglucosaminyldiphosphoundecaprenol N-acetyl-beta-D-mannosaminyltransferase
MLEKWKIVIKKGRLDNFPGDMACFGVIDTGRNICGRGIGMDDRVREKVNILGVPFSMMTMEQTAGFVADIIEDGRSTGRGGAESSGAENNGAESGMAESGTAESGLFHVITGNPEIVMAVENDAHLRRITEQAGLITLDGIGVVMAAKWNSGVRPERVTGIDLFWRLLDEGNKRGWSVYLLGAAEETSREAAERIAADYPGLRVVGRHNGYFSAEEDAGIVAEIAVAKPDLLFVALGAPRAERWIDAYRDVLGAKVAMGIGGTLDVVAGKVKRAPMIWQRLNLEWLHRLLSQPSRWRRQLLLPRFAARAWLRRRR